MPLVKGTSMLTRVVVLAVAVLMLTACEIRLEIGTVVNDDGSGELTLIVAFDEEFRQLAEEGGGEFSGFDEADLPEGWTVEEYRKDGFEGIKATIRFADVGTFADVLRQLDDTGDASASPVSFSGFTLEASGDGFEFRATNPGVDASQFAAPGDSVNPFSGDEPVISGDDPFSGQNPFGDLGGDDLGAMLGDVFSVRFTLRLPGGVTAHNATSVEDGTLVWDLSDPDLPDEIYAMSSASSAGILGDGSGSGGSVGTIALAALVLAALAGGGVMLMRRGGAAAGGESVDGGAVDPVATDVGGTPPVP